MKGLRKILSRFGLAAGLAFVAIQLVPYGHFHSNPPTTGRIDWRDAETERLVRAACYDCHSNETRWPWYGFVAPISWIIRQEVERGRHDLNFSEWDRIQEAAERCAERVERSQKPPWPYSILHRGARLSSDERAALVLGLRRRLGMGIHASE